MNIDDDLKKSLLHELKIFNFNTELTSDILSKKKSRLENFIQNNILLPSELSQDNSKFITFHQTMLEHLSINKIIHMDINLSSFNMFMETSGIILLIPSLYCTLLKR